MLSSVLAQRQPLKLLPEAVVNGTQLSGYKFSAAETGRSLSAPLLMAILCFITH